MSSRHPSFMDRKSLCSFKLLFILLVLGLVHAVFYVFFIPPWTHYDEPSHLEYALLAAKLGRIPGVEERQQDIAYAIGRSMADTGFSQKLAIFPNLDPPEGKITGLGYSQLGGPPLFYWLASIPLRLFPGADVLSQLYLVRLFSTIFYLINVFAAWGLACDLFPAGAGDDRGKGSLHFMHIALPAFLVLWPAHLDIMTAVNTDPPAIAFSGITLWACVRLIRTAYAEHRLDWISLIGMIAAAALAIAFKETAAILVPAVILCLIFSLSQCMPLPSSCSSARLFRRWSAWGVIIVGMVVGTFIIVRGDDAASWIRLTDQADPIRVQVENAPHGEYVGKILPAASRFPDWHAYLYQAIAHGRLPSSLPARFSFGIWMWADQPVDINLPVFSIGPTNYTRSASLTRTPQFFAFSFDLGTYSAPNIRVSFPQILSGNSSSQQNQIYFDGFILVEGDYPLQQSPVFTDMTASAGEWGGKPFTNIIRNGSFELSTLRFSPQLDARLAAFLPDHSLPSGWLQALLDPEGFYWYNRDITLHLFRTFWARFGWGSLSLIDDFPLLGTHPYRVIGYFNLFLFGLTAAVSVSYFWKSWRKASPENESIESNPAVIETAFLFLFTVLMAWILALLRGSLYTGISKMYYPVARYALPAVLPTLLILLTGWGVLTEALQGLNSRARWISIIIFLLIMLMLNAVSLLSISAFRAG